MAHPFLAERRCRALAGGWRLDRGVRQGEAVGVIAQGLLARGLTATSSWFFNRGSVIQGKLLDWFETEGTQISRI